MIRSVSGTVISAVVVPGGCTVFAAVSPFGGFFDFRAFFGGGPEAAAAAESLGISSPVTVERVVLGVAFRF